MILTCALISFFIGEITATVVNHASDIRDMFGNVLFEGTAKWYNCPDGYVVDGFWKNWCQSLHCIENMRCVRPDTPNIISQECEFLNMWSAFDNAGTVQCPEGYFVKGIYSNSNSGGCGLYCWEELHCCKYDERVVSYSTEIYTQNWWGCFDGANTGWCLADDDRYITGFYRNGGHELYNLEEAKTRKLFLVYRTNEPTTNEPTTNEPTTNEPTTNEPTTNEPTTNEPTTNEPTTPPEYGCPNTTQYIDLIIAVDNSCEMTVDECRDQQQLVADIFKTIRGPHLRRWTNHANERIDHFSLRVSYMSMGSDEEYAINIKLSESPADYDNTFNGPINKGNANNPVIADPSAINDIYYNYILHLADEICTVDKLSLRQGNPSLVKILKNAWDLYKEGDSANYRNDKEMIIVSNCAADDREGVCERFVESDRRIIFNTGQGLNIQMVNYVPDAIPTGTDEMGDESTYMACLTEYDPEGRIFVYDGISNKDVLDGIKDSICNRAPTPAPTVDPVEGTFDPTMDPIEDEAHAEGILNVEKNALHKLSMPQAKSSNKDLYTLYTEYSLWVFASIVSLFVLNVCVCAYCKCIRGRDTRVNRRKYGFIDNRAMAIDEEDVTDCDLEENDIEKLMQDQ